MRTVKILMLAILIPNLGFSQESNPHPRRIRLGVPQYSGDGCTDQTASSAISPDEKVLSVLFDDFSISAGGQTGTAFGHRACTVLIPMLLPPNTRLAVVEIDYRGFRSLPKDTVGRFSAQHRFRNRKERLGDAIVINQVMRGVAGEEDGDFIASRINRVRISDCQKLIGLQINAGLWVRTNSQNEEAIMSLDSMDMAANHRGGMRYQLVLQPCQAGEDAPVIPPVN